MQRNICQQLCKQIGCLFQILKRGQILAYNIGYGLCLQTLGKAKGNEIQTLNQLGLAYLHYSTSYLPSSAINTNAWYLT